MEITYFYFTDDFFLSANKKLRGFQIDYGKWLDFNWLKQDNLHGKLLRPAAPQYLYIYQQFQAVGTKRKKIKTDHEFLIFHSPV